MRKLRGKEPYERAFADIAARIQQSLEGSGSRSSPVRMVIAGGAALYLLTGTRVSEDIDASFSKRLLLPEDLSASFCDPDGRARVLYLDRNYNDSLGLLHEDAYDDAEPVEIPGIDRKVLDVRVLRPVDLAVSKLARLADQDREDIALLARRGLIDSASLRKRAEAALGAFVGDLASARTSIDIACRLVDGERRKRR